MPLDLNLRSHLLLETLQIEAGGGGLREVLGALARGFEDHQARLEQLAGEISAEHHDFLAEEWNTLSHGLFGAAFVTCQAYITAVVSSALAFRQHIVDDLEKSPKALPKTKGKLLDLLGTSSSIGLINALANYFKHSEEWAMDEWKYPSNSSKGTIKVLKQWGFDRSYPYLLTDGAKQLGIVDGRGVRALAGMFEDWSRNIVGAARLDAGLPERHPRTPPPDTNVDLDV